MEIDYYGDKYLEVLFQKTENMTEEEVEQLPKRQRITVELKEKIQDVQSAAKDPAYCRFTTNQSMCALNPSWIEDKVIGGVKKSNLSEKRPKKEYLEYGFDEQDRCLYIKCVQENGRQILNFYVVYEQNKVYKIPTDEFGQLDYYTYDTDGRVTECYDNMCRETYQWLNDDVALVKQHIQGEEQNYLLIKNGEEVEAIYFLLYTRENEPDRYFENKACYLKNCDWSIYYPKCTFLEPQRVSHTKYEIMDSKIIDEDGEVTFYHRIELLGQEFVGSRTYQKLPAKFSYKKAKELLKEELDLFIQKKLREVDFECRCIGIQYGTDGYDATEILVGFAPKEMDNVADMEYMEEVDYRPESQELMEGLSIYIDMNHYENAFTKLMETFQKELQERNPEIEVFLEQLYD